jgi:hypothetical protein
VLAVMTIPLDITLGNATENIIIEISLFASILGQEWKIKLQL